MFVNGKTTTRVADRYSVTSPKLAYLKFEMTNYEYSN